MNPEIEAHCQRILSNSNIQNRVVILCEGGTDNIHDGGRLSPQSFKENDRVSDANFYRACTPEWWTNPAKTPFFINSGDRSKVLATFFGLLDLHRQNPDKSYLNPDFLFALVDLDIQPKSWQVEDIDKNYSVYTDVETAFKSIYSQGKFQDNLDPKNHIFVTGLVHKEAYFLLRELQETFNKRQANFEGNLLLLLDLYPQIAQCITQEKDLHDHQNFQRVKMRLQDYSYLDLSTLEKLQESWLNRYEYHHQDRSDLITSLFIICKAKPYWESEDLTFTCPKDEVMLDIAKFYKNKGKDFKPQDQQSDNSPIDHIPCLFRAIYRIAYETS